MLQEELKNEAEVRRFLLGEMPENERNAFEERFVADEDLFEQLRVVEDELIESYVRNTISAEDRGNFERNFLSTEPRRRRVDFARSMLSKLIEEKEITAAKKIETAQANPSVWDSLANLFKTPGLAFGAVLAILMFALGSWFLLKNSDKLEIAQQNKPTPTVAFETIQPNSNQSVLASQRNVANANLNALPEIAANKKLPAQKKETPGVSATVPKEEKPKQERIRASPIFALVAGSVRSEGKMQELNLPKNAQNVSLQLNLESFDYKIYSAEIVDADGNAVSKNNNLKAKNSKINLSVPAARLARGDYTVKLSARNPQNETESVADYAFRVNRK